MEEDITKTISTRDFISTVENEPTVWNTETAEYRDKIAKRNAWNRVVSKYVHNFSERNDAEQLNIVTQFRRKWKGLRSSYSRELLRRKEEKRLGSKANCRKQYSFFKNLNFLLPVSKQTTSGEGDVISEDNDFEDKDFPTPVTLPAKSIKIKKKSVKEESELQKPMLNNIINASVPQFTEYTNAQDSPDKLFMLSLVPELEKLPEEVKLDVKADLLNVFKKARQHITTEK
ncbi:uncharacterized protein LOC143428003 [Xylocopa sonorina]|uniref:uncharacterized protein LOC143428003 n=1 Tax=Xylocopa sonorina TaxID=1818115 RepID=UPI00403B234A